MWKDEGRDWAAIEKRYVEGSERLDELAAAVGVPLRTLERRSKREVWPKKLEKAQTKKTYVVEIPRMRYGEEKRKWPGRVCHDCSAQKGEYHVPSCDVEECPACGRQAISCSCILE